MKKKLVKTVLLIFIITFMLIINNYKNSKFISTNAQNSTSINNECIAHFVDVGQGDCILIQVNNKNILIDSGTNSSEKIVKNYLKKLGIKKIDYLIVTHPHEDHIGGIDKILKNFTVEAIYAPKVITTTTDYINMVAELSKQGKKINIIKKGVSFSLANNSSLCFLSPEDKKYDNINNYSAVIKLKYGNVSFLFTGDSELLIENDLILSKAELSADVLKVGHHGSKTSTSKEFLNMVNPKYAIISCGMGNDYGHPDKQVLNLLTSQDVSTYRTDKDGNIAIYTDGKNIKILKGKKQ